MSERKSHEQNVFAHRSNGPRVPLTISTLGTLRPQRGLGQRVFFLHDGRTNDLVEAIRAHDSAGNNQTGPSEANAVIRRVGQLSSTEQQNLLIFLRSL